MQQLVNKLMLGIACYFLFLPVVYSQKQGKLELYRFMGNDLPASFQPTAQFQSSKNLYAEARYNYEAPGTFSIFAGKNFQAGKELSCSVTPMAGYSLGTFEGISLALNSDLEWKRIYFSSQTQYSMGIKTGKENFLFSWTELGYDFTDNFFGGISFQYTIEAGKAYFEPGFFGGISMGNIEVPLYVFNPFNSDRCFVLGLSYEYNWKKKK